MSEDAEADLVNTGSSPWPMFIALGLALSEVGVLFALRPFQSAGCYYLSDPLPESLQNRDTSLDLLDPSAHRESPYWLSGAY
jgi:hypothetical protein